MIALNLLDFYAETAKTKQAITFKQMTIIARQISEVKKNVEWLGANNKTKEMLRKNTSHNTFFVEVIKKRQMQFPCQGASQNNLLWWARKA